MIREKERKEQKNFFIANVIQILNQTKKMVEWYAGVKFIRQSATAFFPKMHFCKKTCFLSAEVIFTKIKTQPLTAGCCNNPPYY